MEQARDAHGNLMYTDLTFQYKDPGNNDEIEEFVSDGGDSEYQRIFNMLVEADKAYNLDNGYDINGNGVEDEFIDEQTGEVITEHWEHPYEKSLRPKEISEGVYEYDTSSLPVYTVTDFTQSRKDGKWLYTDSEGNEFTLDYSYAKLAENSDLLTEALNAHGEFAPVYTYPKGTVTISPAGSGGMYVNYMPYTEEGTISFDIPQVNGWGIIDVDTRMVVLDNDVSGLPKGTIIYLETDENNAVINPNRIIAAHLPGGFVRFYEQGTYLGMTDENGKDASVYSEASVNYAHFTKGAKLMAHQAATGVYMIPRSIGQVSLLAANAANPVSGYFHSDYFAVNSEGKLVKLNVSETKTIANGSDTDISSFGFAYPDPESEVLFEGAYISTVYETDGTKVMMYVLERKDGTENTDPTTIVLLPDGIWYASNGKAGALRSTEARNTVEYKEETLIEMTETISGEAIQIVFGGEKTTLNDDESYTGMNGTNVTDSEYANVITNNLRIIATDSGNIFGEGDPLVVKPYSGDKVNIQINSNMQDGAYAGDAYIRTILEAKVKLFDTTVAEGGLIDLDVRNGETTLSNVTVNDTGLLDVDVVEGGNVVMNNVKVIGNGEDTEGTLNVDVQGKGGDIDINTADISGDLNINTAEGDMSIKDGKISGTADLVSSGDGDIVLNKVDVADGGLLNMTTTGNGITDMDDVTVGGGSHINTKVEGSGTGNTTTMDDVTIDGTNDPENVTSSIVHTVSGSGDAVISNAIINNGKLELGIGVDGNVTFNNANVDYGDVDVNIGEDGNVTFNSSDIDNTEADVIVGENGDITFSKSNIDDTNLTVNVGADKDNAGNGNVTFDTTNIGGSIVKVDVDGNGNVSLNNVDMINSDVDVAIGGSGATKLTDVTMDKGSYTQSTAGNGTGDDEIRDFIVKSGAEAVITIGGSSDIDLNDVEVYDDGLMTLTIGSGSVDMGKVDETPDDENDDGTKVYIEGVVNVKVDSGKVNVNDVVMANADDDTASAWLNIVTGNSGGTDNDVIIDNLIADERLNIKTTGGDLLMKDNDSRVVLNASFDETNSTFDIGGNIGAHDNYFKIGYPGELEKDSLTLNIINVIDMFLTQTSDLITDLEDLPHSGRLEGEDEKTEHDEAISDLEDKDKKIYNEIPQQTEEELAQQLTSTGKLTEEELLTLIGGKLKGEEFKNLLNITDESIEGVIAALDELTQEELAQMVNDLMLKGSENEDILLEAKETNVDPMKLKLIESKKYTQSQLGRMTSAQIKQAYEAYYNDKVEEYRDAVKASYKADIEARLSSEDYLTDVQVDYLLDRGLTEDEAAVATLLAAAIKAQKVKTDANGDPIRAIDGEGNMLYIDAEGNLTTEEKAADGSENAPAYVMEVIMSDEDELFPAYWKSLTDEQKKALLESAYDVLDEETYPDPEDETARRDLVIKIGTSNGESYILNIGDITVDQKNGTFTAGEVVSSHGDVTITSDAIEGVADSDKEDVSDPYILNLYSDKLIGGDGKGTDSNIYGENITLTAENGGIGKNTEVVTEQASWIEDTISNILGEDNPPDAYSPDNKGTWAITRNETTGKIEMTFEIDFTAIRDIDIETGTNLNANAVEDIAISELTGDMNAENVVSTNGSVTLKANDGSQMIEKVEAKTDATVIAKEDQDIASIEAETGNAVVNAGGDQNIGSVNAGNDADVKAAGQQDIETVTAGNDATVNAGGDQNVGSVTAGNDISMTAGGDQDVDSAAAGSDVDMTTEGTMYIGTVTAGETVDLTANGDIVDDRDEGETKPNVTTENATMNSKEGSIGEDHDNRIDVDIEGTLTTDSKGDTNLNAIGDLNLTADTDEGQINVDSSGDLTITNTDKYNDGDMNLGAIKAEGDVDITAKGGFELLDKLGRDAQVEGDNIDLTAMDGSIGTKEEPMTVDTADGGVLNADATGGEIVITEVDGDLILDKISSTDNGEIDIVSPGGIEVGTVTSEGGGNVTLEAQNGDITESDKTNNDSIKDAADAAVEAGKAQAKVDGLTDQVEDLTDYVDELTENKDALTGVKDDLDKAKDDQNNAQTALDDAKQAQEDAKKTLSEEEEKLEELKNAENPDENAIKEQQQKVDEAKDAYDDAVSNTKDKEEALKDANEAVKEAESAAKDTLNKVNGNIGDRVEGVDDAKNIDEAIKALEDEISEKTDELNDKSDELNEAKKAAEEANQKAEDLADKAEPSGIDTEGDLNLILGSEDGRASVGTEDNALGATADGVISITTDEGTELEEVHLESGDDVQLAPIETNGKTDITANGDITGASDKDEPIITAPELELNSLGGDIGEEDDPLKISVDEIKAGGENIWIENDKDLKIDEIVADEDVTVIVDGDITGGDNEDDIIGGDVELEAEGDIGTQDDPLNVESDEISAKGDDINLESDSDIVVDEIIASGDVTIDTEGSVTDKDDDSIIYADDLTINAEGGVGTQDNPLDVNVSGTITINGGMGKVYIVNHYVPEEDEFPDVLVHKPTGIIVAGKFSEGAYLYVDHECAHIDCPVCRYLKAIEPDKALAYYRIKLIGESYGRIKVSIPVDEIYNGKILTIAYCDDGKLKTVDAVVKDGYVTFIADNFGAFLVLNGKYTVHTSGEGYYEMISDIPHPLRADVYRDVDIDDWYYPSIAYSVFLELIEGTSPGSFDPNASATDTQLIRMLEGIEEQIRRVDKDYEKLDVRNLFGHGSKEALAQSKALEMLLAYANLSGHNVNETDAVKWAKEKNIISSDPPGPISRANLVSTVQNYTNIYGPRFLIVPAIWTDM